MRHSSMGYVAQLSLFLDSRGHAHDTWMIRFRGGFRCPGGNLNVEGEL